MKKLLLIALLIVGCVTEPEDCLGVAGGTAELDNCNVCDTDLLNDCVPDCAGIWGGDAVDDECGVCSGDGSTCAETSHTEPEDCAGVVGGDAVEDNCGTCDSDPLNDCVPDCAGEWGGSAVVDCAGVCGGSSVEDVCGVCEGDGSTCATDGEWIIYYYTSTSIGGFQFNVEGVTVMDAYGGEAGAAGFSISSSATTVLGFSLSGANISIGEGMLVILDIAGDTSAGCLENVIISDSSGNNLNTIVENCNFIHVSE